MRSLLTLSAFLILTISLDADTCLAPKNPVPASVVCGHVLDQIGDPVANVELQLLNDKNVVSSVNSDEHGNFMFPPVPKGQYKLVAKSKIWRLFWPVKVTTFKSATVCKHPLEATVSIGSCGGAISKKGYHVKWAQE